METVRCLGDWATHQRHMERAGKLDSSRRARLGSLDGWVWDLREAGWEEGFAHLQRFVEREGDARVPQRWREDGYRLGQWVSHQRLAHARGKLDASRRGRLEALRGWAWDQLEANWEEGFAALQQFVEREGHARVPRGWREDNFNLGDWATQQRALGRAGKLDTRRRARLASLNGWEWDLRAARWAEGFAHLKRFVEREGDARVPQRWREDGYLLGQWVNEQRHAYGKGKLDPERRARLEALPDWTWEPRKAGARG